MNHKVKIKIIKRAERKEGEPDRQPQPGDHPTREISTTIKLWVSDFKQRRRTQEQHLTLTLRALKNL
jgi:hypothetical protein